MFHISYHSLAVRIDAQFPECMPDLWTVEQGKMFQCHVFEQSKFPSPNLVPFSITHFLQMQPFLRFFPTTLLPRAGVPMQQGRRRLRLLRLRVHEGAERAVPPREGGRRGAGAVQREGVVQLRAVLLRQQVPG